MFKPLDPLLHSELRLAVMSLLISVDEAEFPYIKQQTGATAGNLSVQLDKLATAGYIAIEKTFKGKKPCTLCRITPVGLKAFEDYVAALRTYLAAKPYINVREYCRLTGLKRTAATLELRRLSEADDAWIGTMGQGTHKVYVMKS